MSIYQTVLSQPTLRLIRIPREIHFSVIDKSNSYGGLALNGIISNDYSPRSNHIRQNPARQPTLRLIRIPREIHFS